MDKKKPACISLLLGLLLSCLARGDSQNLLRDPTFAADPAALYLGVQVVDGELLNNEELDVIWKADCVEIYLDTATDENMKEPWYHGHQGKIVCAARTAPTGLAPVAPRCYC